MKRPKIKVVVICGPTGIGKTALSITLAKKFNAEIISADSVQIYKYLDIGTAKPTRREQSQVTHHMIDIVAPDSDFDANMYLTMADKKIIELNKKGIIPFIVGGSGLYIKALLHGLSNPDSLSVELRNNLKNMAQVRGSGYLHRQLEKIDPDAADKIHVNDAFRIIRALEVYQKTGTPITHHHKAHEFSQNRFISKSIGLFMPRERLYDRINLRVDEMIANGFIDEVRYLLERGYSPELKSMGSIGYRHFISYVTGKIQFAEAVRTLKRDTRRYAKRQMTWFKADPSINWFKPSALQKIKNEIQTFLLNNHDNPS